MHKRKEIPADERHEFCCEFSLQHFKETTGGAPRGCASTGKRNVDRALFRA